MLRWRVESAIHSSTILTGFWVMGGVVKLHHSKPLCVGLVLNACKGRGEKVKKHPYPFRILWLGRHYFSNPRENS